MNRTVRKSVLLVFAALVLGAGLASANAEAEKAAVKAAESWLALVDDGHYARSWEAAARYLKGVVKREQLEGSLRGVRDPLGEVISRRVVSKEYTTSLPGAPDGEYVIIQFKTSFANKRSAVETVTPMREKDGTWRVSGYYIK